MDVQLKVGAFTSYGTDEHRAWWYGDERCLGGPIVTKFGPKEGWRKVTLATFIKLPDAATMLGGSGRRRNGPCMAYEAYNSLKTL